jgi:hypothetical protein
MMKNGASSTKPMPIDGKPSTGMPDAGADHCAADGSAAGNSDPITTSPALVVMAVEIDRACSARRGSANPTAGLSLAPCQLG